MSGLRLPPEGRRNRREPRRTRDSLSQFINTKLAPTDMMALVSTGGRMASLQQFTGDKPRLLSAVNRITASSQHSSQGGGQYKLTAAEATRINAGDAGVLEAVARRVSSQSLANQSGGEGSIAAQTRGGLPGSRGDDGTGGGGGTADDRLLRDRIRQEAQGRLGEIAAESRTTLKSLTNLFQAMSELPGRKVVLLLSESFTTLGGSTEDQSSLIQQAIDLARRSGISVYALDAGGLRTNSATAGEYVTAAGLRASDLSGNTTFSDFENLSAARAMARSSPTPTISSADSTAPSRTPAVTT